MCTTGVPDTDELLFQEQARGSADECTSSCLALAGAPEVADKASKGAEDVAKTVADRAKPTADNVSDQIESGADDVADKAKSTAKDASKAVKVSLDLPHEGYSWGGLCSVALHRPCIDCIGVPYEGLCTLQY